MTFIYATLKCMLCVHVHQFHEVKLHPSVRLTIGFAITLFILFLPVYAIFM